MKIQPNLTAVGDKLLIENLQTSIRNNANTNWGIIINFKAGGKLLEERRIQNKETKNGQEFKDRVKAKVKKTKETGSCPSSEWSLKH